LFQENNEINKIFRRQSCLGAEFFDGMIEGKKVKYEKLENKLKYYYENYNKEEWVNQYMNFEDNNKEESDDRRDKWKIIADLICSKGRLEMREVLK